LSLTAQGGDLHISGYYEPNREEEFDEDMLLRGDLESEEEEVEAEQGTNQI